MKKTYKQLKARLEAPEGGGEASECTGLLRKAKGDLPAAMKKETYKKLKARLEAPEGGAKGDLPAAKGGDIGDVSLTLALSNLVYTIAYLRLHALNTNWKEVFDPNSPKWPKAPKAPKDENDEVAKKKYQEDKKKYEEEKEDARKMSQLLVGKFDFIGGVAKSEDVPAHPLDLLDLEQILEEEGNGSEEFTDELTYRCMEMLKGATATRYKAFINNFDAASINTELVYAITALIPNDPQQTSQVSVVFRGSSNLSDWMHNVQFIPAKLSIRIGDIKTRTHKRAWLVESVTGTGQKIPISLTLAKQLKERLEKLHKNHGDPDVDSFEVHSGFLKYLFAEQKSSNISKYESIKLNLIQLMTSQSCSRCDLKVTGHSLGGALSSLCSFLLACDEGVWGAVQTRGGDSSRFINCISFAAPHVGGDGYRVAHELLLEQKRLKHLRVTTDRDFVPVGLPLVSPGLRQTGLNVHLRPSGLHIGPRTSVKNTQDVPKAFGREWPRLEILGLFSTTFPILPWIPIYSVIVRVIDFFVLPLVQLPAWLLGQSQFPVRLLEHPAFRKFDTVFIGSLFALQILLFFTPRKPQQVAGVLGSKWITHSLSEYYKNLIEDNGNKSLTNSKDLFEKGGVQSHHLTLPY